MITFEDIKNNNPLLIVYPAGTGGEFISNVISQASNSFHELTVRYDADINRFNVSCPIDYFTNWSDVENPHTWINPGFTNQVNGLRSLIKDHPMPECFKYYRKYMPEVSAIYMTPFSEFEYFSKLLFIKTSKMHTSPIDRNFIHFYISPKLPEDRVEKLVRWANSNTTFWMHELHTVNTWLSMGRYIDHFVHNANLSDYVDMHVKSIQDDFRYVLPIVCYNISNTRLINCDSLATDSVNFWRSVQQIINDLDVELAIAKTETWITNNNKLINNK
jgi:hypothetical protein